MAVVSRVSLRVFCTWGGEAIGNSPVGRAQGVPAVRRVIVGMIVLTRLQNTLTGLFMGLIPGNGMLRGLDGKCLTRGDCQKRAYWCDAREHQFRFPVNCAAAASWPCRMLSSVAC
jgi:hypothetical protein